MYLVEISGVVQGVGFRPFIHNLALSFDLKGYVINNGYGVSIIIQASKDKVEQFTEQIKLQKPILSKIESIHIKQIKSKKIFKSFKIKKTKKSNHILTMIPSDIAMCKECQEEIEDKNNRRYRYPFITCTNCGPRYSIIKTLPYDRCNTSMDKFIMCKKCKKEYKNPKDRRYHAQPIGCFECGPSLLLLNNKAQTVEVKNDKFIDKIVKFISDGKIVAIKGIGGYHLICDATNDEAVQLLRDRKKRPSKPFAIMVKDINTAKQIAAVNKNEEELLSSNKRPIVLLKKNKINNLSKLIAPDINQIGLFLPYTPLHHLILQKLDNPIVATSANISNEPLCTTYEEIMQMSSIWDYCLDHNRDIVNSCDDSVLFWQHDNMFMLRGARGYTPKYLNLPKKTNKNILSLGANQKSTVAITVKDKVILSPYIGDLEGISSINHFKSNIDILMRIYNFSPDIIVCDKHPNYESTKLAFELKSKNKNLELIQVQHHYAHILATMGVNNITSKVLGVSFDGTGYGDDGNLWGGEFLVCERNGYERVGHFKYFKLLGGKKAIKEPRRIALSFLFDIYGENIFEIKNNTVKSFSKHELKTLYQVWQKGLNSPLTSSCGRLFDCVASLINIKQICSYEGESGLLLENFYDANIKDIYKFSFDNGQIDFSQIVNQILEDIAKEENIKIVVVSKFFNTIVEIIFTMYKKYDLPLVLGGGVFQNRILLQLLIDKIPNIILPKDFVSNDSAIAFGQALAVINKDI
ncbi:MAG: carbamoyltransferase HypF [Arcobacteraceae bacterium]|nr:carbamoyltransferase HypF [Arcobacteraceae bacterium]